MIPWWVGLIMGVTLCFSGFAYGRNRQDVARVREKRRLTHFCDECGSLYDAVEAGKNGRGALGPLLAAVEEALRLEASPK
jgi:hypothetical protein